MAYHLPKEEPCTRPGCDGTALLMGSNSYMCLCGKLREVPIDDLVDPNAVPEPKRNRGGRGGRTKRKRARARKRDKHLPH